MVKLPVLAASDVIRALSKVGYQNDHQSGSHMILRHVDPPFRRITVPNHKELAKGTLRSIIRQAGLTKQEFVKLLE